MAMFYMLLLLVYRRVVVQIKLPIPIPGIAKGGVGSGSLPEKVEQTARERQRSSQGTPTFRDCPATYEDKKYPLVIWNIYEHIEHYINLVDS